MRRSRRSYVSARRLPTITLRRCASRPRTSHWPPGSCVVATVISFPFGYEATAVKVAAVREAVTRGASELDVVMNISKFLSGEFGYVADELASLTQEVSVVAMNNGLNDVVVKVIIEAAYLSDKMKRLATQIVAASGADFVKTS